MENTFYAMFVREERLLLHAWLSEISIKWKKKKLQQKNNIQPFIVWTLQIRFNVWESQKAFWNTQSILSGRNNQDKNVWCEH